MEVAHVEIPTSNPLLLADDIPMEATQGKHGERTPYLHIILLCRCDNGIEARNAV
jgi:hypothetical protein